MNAQHEAQHTTAATPRRGYLNAILTANAVVLGVIALNGLGLTGGLVSVSNAQTEVGDDSNRVSAAEQRKDMIIQLRAIQQRLDKIDATLAKGVNVKVTNFPSDFGQPKGEMERADRAERSKPEVTSRPGAPVTRTGGAQPK